MVTTTMTSDGNVVASAASNLQQPGGPMMAMGQLNPIPQAQPNTPVKPNYLFVDAS